MRAIPVDTSRVQFLATGKAVARAVYAELTDGSRRRVPDRQEMNDDGVPMWTLDVLVDDPDADRAEVVGVKVASYDEPAVEKFRPVQFVNLVAVPYVQQGTNRVAISMRADGIEVATGKAAAA
ncbi:hypothetical protein GCM10023215_02310 [Pseudonocardia yuanmonensis]|uniref:Plasmid replication, integration and excision activator n=1 Tax=Pseudonocardia yuanmonensis TaxID=1095914 RepID=A0ABP8VW10_9PSEU